MVAKEKRTMTGVFAIFFCFVFLNVIVKKGKIYIELLLVFFSFSFFAMVVIEIFYFFKGW